MHGRVKIRTTAEQEALKKIEREKKVIQYKDAINLIFEKRKNKIYDDELMFVTEQMVLKVSDIHTLWNIRREAFEQNQWNEEEYIQRLKKELTLTENCLRDNPKSYSVWHQRCWVIDHLSSPDWNLELSLCAKCLNLDERNFHCWDYRNYLVKKAGISDEDELKFSTDKIFSNFSNYSSWHYRSKLLSKMFPDKARILPIDADKHREELDIIMNATFTDPNDSSAWFYQRWLLDYTEKQPNTIWQIQIDAKRQATVIFQEKTCIKPNDDNFSVFIKLKNQSMTDDDTKNTYIKCSNVWRSYDNQTFSTIWNSDLTNESNNDELVDIFIKCGDQTYNLSKVVELNIWYYQASSPLHNKHNKSQLKEQLENYKELVKMEPNNKWAILTSIFLMKGYDFVSFHESILKDLNSLMKIDKLRANYYNDIRSKCIMDYQLHIFQQNPSCLHTDPVVDLSNLNLTIFYNAHYFALCEEVNLSGNQLNNSLHRLSALQNCKELSLCNNGLKSVKNLPFLPNLQRLLLQENQLDNVDEIRELMERHKKLSFIDLRDNPVCFSVDIRSLMSIVHIKI